MKNKTLILIIALNILMVITVVKVATSPQKFSFKTVKSSHIELQSGDYRGLLKVTDGFWVGNGKKLDKVNHSGSVLDSINFDQKVMTISRLNKKSLLVALINSVYIVTDRKKEKFISLAENSYITDLVSDDKSIYIADAGRRRLIAVNLTTKKVVWEKSGFKIPSPYFTVDINPNGELWVVNPGEHKLLNIDKSTGEEMASWQPMEDKFVGCCNPALMLAINNGQFVTFEKGAFRLQLFTPAGTVKKSLATTKDFPINQFKFSIDYAENTLYLLDDSEDQIRVFNVD